MDRGWLSIAVIGRSSPCTFPPSLPLCAHVLLRCHTSLVVPTWPCTWGLFAGCHLLCVEGSSGQLEECLSPFGSAHSPFRISSFLPHGSTEAVWSSCPLDPPRTTIITRTKNCCLAVAWAERRRNSNRQERHSWSILGPPVVVYAPRGSAGGF